MKDSPWEQLNEGDVWDKVREVCDPQPLPSGCPTLPLPGGWASGAKSADPLISVAWHLHSKVTLPFPCPLGHKCTNLQKPHVNSGITIFASP